VCTLIFPFVVIVMNLSLYFQTLFHLKNAVKMSKHRGLNGFLQPKMA
jgi:hypothetical protein